MTHTEFVKHFDLLAGQPNAVAKMRELVLELAVRGKLVAQNPDDEPAGRIVERAKSYLAPQRRKFASEDYQKPQDNLPANWCWSRLIELGETAPRNKLNDKTEVGFSPMRLIPAEFGGKILFERKKWGEIRRGFTHFANGDVVLAKITPCFENRKSAVIRDLPSGFGAGTTELHVFRSAPKCVLPEYALIFFKSHGFLANGESCMTGSAGQKRVPWDYFAKSPFLLPPLAEQRRIVAKVDELMALCDELDQKHQERDNARSNLQKSALHHLLAARDPQTFAPAWHRVRDRFHLLHDTPDAMPQLRQAILTLAVQGKLVTQNPNDKLAFTLVESIRKKKEKSFDGREVKEISGLNDSGDGDIQFDLPPGWQNVRLGDIAEIGSGSTPTSTNPNYYEGGKIPWVTSSATSEPFIEKSEVLITEKAIADFRLKLYAPGTILIALYGQGKTRGQVSRLRIAATVNQACATIVLPNGYEALGDYVVLVLREQYLRIREQSAGGAQPNLNGSKIKKLSLALPPLAEQKRIVARVEELMRWCNELEEQLKCAQNIGTQLLDSAIHNLLQNEH